MLPISSDPSTPSERQIQVSFSNLDPHRRLFDGAHLDGAPTFTTQLVAKVFFFRSPSWLRLGLREGKFDYERPAGEAVGPERVPMAPRRNSHNVRQFSLADVEEMAYNAHANGLIAADHMVRTLMVLHAIGRGYRVIP